MRAKTHLVLAGGMAVVIAALSSWAFAQQPQPQAQPRPATKAPAAPAGRAATKEARDEAAGRTGDSALRQRIEHLEEQIVDMQVTIGTLESLARPGGASPSASTSPLMRPGAGSEADQARIESLETQVRALTNQLEQMAEQMRQLADRRTDAGDNVGMPARREADAARPEAWNRPAVSSEAGRGAIGGFGSTTVTPGGRDPIGRLIDPPQDASLRAPGSASSANPKELYETAYGYLLQQDYGAAEVAFEEFLRLFPGDRLAADAQYWLGESLYVQRRYKPAAQAFLKVIQSHQDSAKVPNSLLKLAMTLEQLGQKDCALFNEIDSRASAPPDIKSKARVVRQRVGC
jgi:tol-pal system protein YbgF